MDRMVPRAQARWGLPAYRGPLGYLEVTCPHGTLWLWQSASVRRASNVRSGQGLEMGELCGIG